jgi:eukaryotic-like serine/threonine-protein kinase
VTQAPLLESFGRYRLVWLLCQGGMAELYLALRSGIEGFEKVVALKRILPSITQEPSFVDMFLDEARLAAKLDHPNIVRIYDLGEIDQQYFMAMEYLPGEDLREIFRQAAEARVRVPIDVACWIGHEAAVALDFAHNLTDAHGEPMSLVHRDVSPSNIIVTYYGAVKLVDFGIAKATNSSVHTQTGSFKGKLPYSSPEQLRSDDVDRRADIFGIGITLWEILTGERLFRRDSYAAIVHAVKHDPIPRPSTLRSDVPPELDRVVLRALERDREARYQTALEMQLELEGVLDRWNGQLTGRQIGQWLSDLFGEARSSTKTAMALGKHIEAPVEGIMQPLRPLFQPRAWTAPPRSGGSVPPSIVSAAANSPVELDARTVTTGASREAAAEDPVDRTSPAPPQASRSLLMFAVLTLAAASLVAALLLVATAFWYAQKDRRESVSAFDRRSESAEIVIDSDPEGAAIFLDGEPVGLSTPATIGGFPGGERLSLRLDKPGYQTRREEVELQPGQRYERRLSLNPVDPKGDSRVDRRP